MKKQNQHGSQHRHVKVAKSRWDSGKDDRH